jgi:tetratricopeptide (TPR) repeat protein
VGNSSSVAASAAVDDSSADASVPPGAAAASSPCYIDAPELSAWASSRAQPGTRRSKMENAQVLLHEATELSGQGPQHFQAAWPKYQAAIKAARESNEKSKIFNVIDIFQTIAIFCNQLCVDIDNHSAEYYLDQVSEYLTQLEDQRQRLRKRQPTSMDDVTWMQNLFRVTVEHHSLVATRLTQEAPTPANTKRALLMCSQMEVLLMEDNPVLPINFLKEQALERACKMNFTYASVYEHIGRFSEAIERGKQALESLKQARQFIEPATKSLVPVLFDLEFKVIIVLLRALRQDVSIPNLEFETKILGRTRSLVQNELSSNAAYVSDYNYIVAENIVFKSPNLDVGSARWKDTLIYALESANAAHHIAAAIPDMPRKMRAASVMLEIREIFQKHGGPNIEVEYLTD